MKTFVLKITGESPRVSFEEYDGVRPRSELLPVVQAVEGQHGPTHWILLDASPDQVAKFDFVDEQVYEELRHSSQAKHFPGLEAALREVVASARARCAGDHSKT